MLQPKLSPSAGSKRLEPQFLDDVRYKARHNWHWVASRCGVPSEALTGLRSPCPACGDAGVFRFLDDRGGGTFVCRGNGRADATGDGFALLRHVFGLDFGQAVRMAAQVMRVRDVSAFNARGAA